MSKTRNSHGIKAGKIVENFKQYLTLTLMNRNNKRNEIPRRQSMLKCTSLFRSGP